MQIISLIGVLPRAPGRDWKKRDESSIRRIVIHHTAGSETASDKAPPVLAGYAKSHIASKDKYVTLGYHYVIAKDGVVFKCNPYTRLTYHARGGNADGIGIAVMGNFMEKLPAPQALASLVELTDILQATLPNDLDIVGHREVQGSRTLCPGDAFMQWIRLARQQGEI